MEVSEADSETRRRSEVERPNLAVVVFDRSRKPTLLNTVQVLKEADSVVIR
jgi:hypothetical protein